MIPKKGHIINGHTPVRAGKGESPVKADGKLFIIDGGFCEAYQKTTGIAGYTLVYNSHGLKIKAHRPFEGIAKAIDENADIESEAEQVESFPDAGISPIATTVCVCASASRHSRRCLRHIARVSFNSLHFSQPCVKMRSSGIRQLAISK